MAPASFRSDTTLQQVYIHLRGTTSISYLRILEKEITLFLRSVDPSCQTCCKVSVRHTFSCKRSSASLSICCQVRRACSCACKPLFHCVVTLQRSSWYICPGYSSTGGCCERKIFLLKCTVYKPCTTYVPSSTWFWMRQKMNRLVQVLTVQPSRQQWITHHLKSGYRKSRCTHIGYDDVIAEGERDL